jgi:hypothetical protein
MSSLKQLTKNTFGEQSCKVSKGFEAGMPSNPIGKKRPFFCPRASGLTCRRRLILGGGVEVLSGVRDRADLREADAAGHWVEIFAFPFH